YSYYMLYPVSRLQKNKEWIYMSDKKQPTITTAIIRRIPWKKLLFIILGAAICSFGIHNIHQRADITEGGIIGLMLLTEHWLGISPAYITPVLDIICYLLAFKYLGGKFIIMSVLSTFRDQKSTRLNSSHVSISYAVFCFLKRNSYIK